LDKVRLDIQAMSVQGAHWYLWICDPLFGAKRDQLAALCTLLEGSPHSFLVESRVDVLHPDDLPQLRAAGCSLIYFGLEAVSARALNELDKLSPKHHARYLNGARALVEACLENEILPVMGLLQPVPGDGSEDLAEALSFLEELAALPKRMGAAAHGLGPCFHAFPLRFDRGAPYDQRGAELAAMGVEYSGGDGFLEDRHLSRASASIGPVEAERFRQAVRALNPQDPKVQRRLLSSYPRPFVEFTL